MTNWSINYETKEVSVECSDGSRFSFIATCDVYNDYELACEIREKIFGQ